MTDSFFGDLRINLLIAFALSILGIYGKVELVGAIIIIAYWISIRGFEKFESSYAKLLSFITILLITFGLSVHIFPGFNNMIYLKDYAVSEASRPHDEYWNFDKPFLILCLFNYYMEGYYKRGNLIHSIKVGLILTLVCASILIVAGMGLGYIALDIKWPQIIYSWTLLNLIAVLAEEGFYRAFLQRFLADFYSKILGKYADILALLVTSALFGLSHYKMGFIHASLCSVAGFLFGYGLTRSRRVEACMITHFLLNMAHLIFFTYPNAA